MALLDRFLRYVRIDTQSDPHSATSPTTPGQWDLLRLLHEELTELGIFGVATGGGGAENVCLGSPV